MNKRTIGVVVGAFVLLLAVAGVLVWMGRTGRSPGASGTAGASPSQSSSVPTAPVGAVSSGAATPGMSPATSPGGSASAGSQKKPSPAPTGPEPLTAKKPLPTITVAPQRTLAYLEPKVMPAGTRYSATFVPFGYGPGGKGHTLVVQITRAEALGARKNAYPLTGRNVLLDVTGVPASSAIAMGGTYTGTIVFVTMNGMLAPRLTAVR